MMRTANPALNEKTFASVETVGQAEDAMTLSGTANKTIMLLAFVFIAASFTWRKFFLGSPAQELAPWIWGGAIGGFVTALITVFNKKIAGITGPIYALCEGLFLGALSAVFERQYPGVVLQAVALTFGTLFCLLIAYKTRLIKPSENFKLGIAAATGGICLVYFLSMILGFFGIHFSLIYGSGPAGILFSGFVVVIAALNLVLDFDFIENACARGVPKYMEWYAAFGLIVTLVWLYIEILRLLTKLRDRR